MSNRWTIGLAAVALVTSAACEDDTQPFTGRYQLQVFESRDNCDGTTNNFGLTLLVERTDQQVTLTFGDDWVVSGTFDNEGILQAEGTVENQGTAVTFLQVQVDFRSDGRGLNGNGQVTYNGTFPDVEGQCSQDIVFSGARPDASVSPTFLTGPDAR